MYVLIYTQNVDDVTLLAASRDLKDVVLHLHKFIEGDEGDWETNPYNDDFVYYDTTCERRLEIQTPRTVILGTN